MADSIELVEVVKALPVSDKIRYFGYDPVSQKLYITEHFISDLVEALGGKVDLLNLLLSEANGEGLVVRDQIGRVLLQSDSDGLHLPGGIVRPSPGNGHGFGDFLGYMLHTESSDGFSQRDIRIASAHALAYSQQARSIINNDTAGLNRNLNHVIGWGQSLEAGQECFPALTRTPRQVRSESAGSDALMIGQSIRSSNQYENAFNPVGDSTLQPLIATVQNNNGGAVLNDAQVAALPAGDPSNGETPLEGAIQAFLQILDYAAPQAIFRMLATNVSVGGQNIANLKSKYFGRMSGAIAAGKAAADSRSWSYGLVAVDYCQGEQDYADGTTYDVYKAALLDMYISTLTALQNVNPQSAAPLWVLSQTSAPFVVDATQFSIGMAQWDLSKDNPNFAISTPTYPFPDKTLHLDSNGSRWRGMYTSKVLYHQLYLRRRWRPLEPIKAVYRGRQILVSFSVPVAPLKWSRVFEQNTPTDRLNRGFTVTDTAGNKLPIQAIEIAGDPGLECCVLITLVDVPPGRPKVWAGRRDDGYGGTNLSDSDPMTSSFLYEYRANSGQYASANLAEFVNKPYPLNNFSVCFIMEAEAG